MAIVAYVLLGLGGFFTLCNWLVVVSSASSGRGHSFGPFLGGLLAFAGCALLPAIGWKLGLLAFVVDPGCWVLPCLIYGAVAGWHRFVDALWPSAE
ncbi:MAG TPA: hypothetical protein VIV11_00670 [Kofleriaceae bacterium]